TGETIEHSIFLGINSPPAGSTITLQPGVGATVSTVYSDEAALNTVVPDPTCKPTYSIVDTSTSPPTTVASGEGCGGPPGGLTCAPTATPTGGQKFSSLLSAILPANSPAGTYRVTITAFDGDQNKPGGDFGTVSWTFHVLAAPAPPDIAVHKTAPATARLGDDLSYTVTASNTGTVDAPNVVATDTLPTGATFVSASPSQGTCSQSGGTVTCNLGTLPI